MTGTSVTVAVVNDNGSGNVDRDLDGTLDLTSIVIDPTDIDGDGNPATLTVTGEGVWATTPAGEIVFTPEAGFTADPTPITYTIADDDGNVSNPATVTLDYDAIPPTAVSDENLSNVPGTTVGVLVAANDTDADGAIDPTSVSLIDPVGAINITQDAEGDTTSFEVPGEGRWIVNPITGEVSFVPEAGFTNDPTPITYTIDDNDGNVSPVPATITIDYNPIATDDTVANNTPGVAVVIPVLANDTAGDLVDPTTVQIVGTANPGDDFVVTGQGVWRVDPVNGDITFIPEVGFTADPTAIMYTVADDEGNVSNPATVTLGFNPLAPTAVDDTRTGVNSGDAVTVQVLDNDNDPDGNLEPATVQIVGTTSPGEDLVVPGEGVWRVNPADGAITFTPEASFTGDPTPIMYTVEDNDGNVSNSATVSIDYDAEPPVATANTSAPTPSGQAAVVNVVNDDTDSDGTIDPTRVSLVIPTGATMIELDTEGDIIGFTVLGEGVWEVNPLGDVIFSPESGFTLDPTPVNYTVRDNDGNLSNEAQVTIDYMPGAVGDISADNAIGLPVVIDVLSNDITGDTVDPTTVQIVGTTNPGDDLVVAGQGTWSVDPVNGQLTFTPIAGFEGDPTPIEYTVRDAEGNVSNPATVTVTFGECNVLGAGDCDGDGVPNNLDPEPLNPCIGGDVTAVDLTDRTSLWYTADCDGDGVTNGEEVDLDRDGIPDTNGTDPNDPCDYDGSIQDVSITTTLWRSLDCDGDGVSNGTEISDGTNPRNTCDYLLESQDISSVTEDWLVTDCDGDGVTNETEVTRGTDELDPCSFSADAITLPVTANVNCLAAIEVTKTAEVLGTNAGDEIAYTITVENTGSVAITALTLNDIFTDRSGNEFRDAAGAPIAPLVPEFNSATLNSPEGELLAGEIATYTVSYIITEAAIDAGGVSNTVMATGEATNGSQIVSDSSDDGDDLDGNTEDDPTETVLVRDGDLEVFNLISPNDDANDTNETFVITNADLFPNNTLEIYNRWGNIVYKKRGYNNEFRGISNGRAILNQSDELPEGTYYYVFDKGDGSPAQAGWLYINR